jgi:hypothetical protein
MSRRQAKQASFCLVVVFPLQSPSGSDSLRIWLRINQASFLPPTNGSHCWTGAWTFLKSPWKHHQDVIASFLLSFFFGASRLFQDRSIRHASHPFSSVSPFFWSGKEWGGYGMSKKQLFETLWCPELGGRERERERERERQREREREREIVRERERETERER